MKNPYYYEVHEGDQDGVKRIAICGSEEDARMMMSLAPQGKNRSWIRCQFLPPDTIDTNAEVVHQDVLPQRKDLPQGNQVVWTGPDTGFGFR